MFLDRGGHVETGLSEFNVDPEDPAIVHVELLDPTPLVLAAYLDNVPMARLLLQYGANLVRYDVDGEPDYSTIHAARSAEMVQLLLDHNADPNQYKYDGGCYVRPLHYYARRGNLEAMRVALDNDAYLYVGEAWATPLHEAAKHSTDAVRLLLYHGSNPLERDEVDWATPLHEAVRFGVIDAVNMEGYTPLHLAATDGNVDMVRLLVELSPKGRMIVDDE
jgi:ankyrin repeat protein